MRWAKVILGAILEIAIVVALLATLRYASRVQERLIGAPSADDRLFLAAWQGDDELFDQAVRDGGGALARDSQGSTPLHFAAQSGHVRLARRLLELGADVNATNAWGVTPLMYAGGRNRERVVALLLQAGADPDLRTCDGNSNSPGTAGAGGPGPAESPPPNPGVHAAPGPTTHVGKSPDPPTR